MVHTGWGPHLDEDGEYDDGDGGRDEQVLPVDVVGQSEDQGEADGAPQAAVGQAELVLEVERDGPERVDDLGQDQDACQNILGGFQSGTT